MTTKRTIYVHLHSQLTDIIWINIEINIEMNHFQASSCLSRFEIVCLNKWGRDCRFDQRIFIEHSLQLFISICFDVDIAIDDDVELFTVCELQNPSMSTFLNGLEASGWIKHIKSVVDTSVFIAKVKFLFFNKIFFKILILKIAIEICFSSQYYIMRKLVLRIWGQCVWTLDHLSICASESWNFLLNLKIT